MRAAILLAALVLGSTACDGGSSPSEQAQQQQADYAESSASFDPDEVQPFLERLSRSIDAGFGAEEIEQVMTVLRQQAVGEESELEFMVAYRGDKVPLNLTLYMDTVDSPELYFFTSPGLAERLDELMDERAQELEQQQQP